MSISVIIQLVIGLVLGAIFLWAVQEYGWESPRTIWVAIVLIGAVLAANLADLRARIVKLEKKP